MIYYSGAHNNKVVTQMCNIKTRHYDIRAHVFMDFGNIRLIVIHDILVLLIFLNSPFSDFDMFQYVSFFFLLFMVALLCAQQ